MQHHPTPAGLDIPGADQPGIVLPGDKRGAQAVRLACIRAAAETGMPANEILPTARQWAAFTLGTDQTTNNHITR